MSETDNEVAAAPGNRVLAIKKIYTKDLSFETPNSPEIFLDDWKPEVDVRMRTDIKPINDSDSEVVLNVTLTVRLGQRTAYLVEVHQAGIFEASGYQEAELEEVLGGQCPQILFPYLRETISDVVTRGGFPPFIMAPMNLEAMFAHQKVQRAAASAGGPSH